MSGTGKKVGLFGGTFDPVHHGHLIIAQAVLEQTGLDRMIFIPSARPPHKGEDIMFSAAVRFALLSRAVRDNESFCVSDVEMRRKGFSYTIDTIREMKAQYPPSTEFFFLVGMDNLYEIQTWRNPRGILEECTVLVADRACAKDREVPRWIQERVRRVRVPLIEISSTAIRQRIREGKNLRYLVPTGVEEMIYELVPRRPGHETGEGAPLAIPPEP